MNRSVNYLLLLILGFSTLACTGARWTVKEKSAVDRDDYSVVSTQEFLSTSSPVSPESPNLKLQILSDTKYEYAEKVLVQRNIQDYKLKPGFIALGLIGAGLAAYAANSNAINGGQSSAASLSLNTAAVIIAGAGLMNMKPSGDSRQTGEERFLRKTGTFIERDTVQIKSTKPDSALIDIWYGQNMLVENESRNFSEGELTINLGGLLSALDLKGSDTEKVRAKVRYSDSTYTFEYPLDKVLLPFARVTSPVAELRSTPRQDNSNILAELIQGSQLQIVESIDSTWYKILYGISENYIAQEDADLIWRNSDFSRESEVVAVPIVPFGNIDVENNIPILTGVNENTLGLIVSNEDYTEPYEKRSHAHRDARMLKAYMENALGVQTENTYETRDLTDLDSITEIINDLKGKANDSTDVYVYINGYGTVSREGDTLNLGLKTIGNDSGSIKISGLFQELSEITDGKVIVLADIEFNALANTSLVSETEIDLEQPLRKTSQPLIETNPNATVIFGAQINQNSELYVTEKGEDKKHHIFPYFFAKALQERRTEVSSIFQYLQRNIPYTSRRLHDRSQDPQIFGNTTQELIPVK